MSILMLRLKIVRLTRPKWCPLFFFNLHALNSVFAFSPVLILLFGNWNRLTHLNKRCNRSHAQVLASTTTQSKIRATVPIHATTHCIELKKEMNETTHCHRIFRSSSVFIFYLLHRRIETTGKTLTAILLQLFCVRFVLHTIGLDVCHL